jgi:mono/diheme cytochrome c family protein
MNPRTNPRFVVSLVTLALLGAGSVHAAFAAPARGSAPAGKTIYDTKCVACHKVDGTGGIQLASTLTPNWKSPATWSDPKRRDMDGYLRNSIANGNLAKGMVPWVKSGQLKPADVDNVIAHIHVLSGRK